VFPTVALQDTVCWDGISFSTLTPGRVLQGLAGSRLHDSLPQPQHSRLRRLIRRPSRHAGSLSHAPGGHSLGRHERGGASSQTSCTHTAHRGLTDLYTRGYFVNYTRALTLENVWRRRRAAAARRYCEPRLTQGGSVRAYPRSRWSKRCKGRTSSSGRRLLVSTCALPCEWRTCLSK
jgi:hypothetical protein